MKGILSLLVVAWMLAACSTAAPPPAPTPTHTPTAKPTPMVLGVPEGASTELLDDGAIVITDLAHGYQFTLPPGWQLTDTDDVNLRLRAERAPDAAQMLVYVLSGTSASLPINAFSQDWIERSPAEGYDVISASIRRTSHGNAIALLDREWEVPEQGVALRLGRRDVFMRSGDFMLAVSFTTDPGELQQAKSDLVQICDSLTTLSEPAPPAAAPELAAFDGAQAEIAADNSTVYTDSLGGYSITLPEGWTLDADDQPAGIFIPRLSAAWFTLDSALVADVHVLLLDLPDDVAMEGALSGLASGYMDGITPDETLMLSEQRTTAGQIELHLVDTLKSSPPYWYRRTVFLQPGKRVLEIDFSVHTDDPDWALPVVDQILESVEALD